MVDNAFGDFFLSDVEDELLEEEDDLISVPVVVPAAVGTAPPTAAVLPARQAEVAPAATPSQAPAFSPPGSGSGVQVPASAPATVPEPSRVTPPVTAAPLATADAPVSREDRLAAALNKLMQESREIQASALVSLDGFTMASALPEGMQEDRVGAMSAAILGLGERAAVELGRGSLTQVFIEGDDGYVMLIAAGGRAALTCLADKEAKLGLVLYDMRTAAQDIAQILG